MLRKGHAARKHYHHSNGDSVQHRPTEAGGRMMSDTWILEPQGTSAPGKTFNPWIKALTKQLKIKCPLAAMEIEKKAKRAMPALPKDPPEEATEAEREEFKAELKAVFAERKDIKDQRIQICAIRCAHVSEDIYDAAKTKWNEVDSEGDVPKTIQTLKEAHLSDAPVSDYEQIQIATTARNNFIAQSQGPTESIEHLFTRYRNDVLHLYKDYGIVAPEPEEQGRDLINALNEKFAALQAQCANDEARAKIMPEDDAEEKSAKKKALKAAYPRSLETAYALITQYKIPMTNNQGKMQSITFATFLSTRRPSGSQA